MFNRRRENEYATGGAATATSSSSSSSQAASTTLFGRPIQNSIRQPSNISRQEHINSYVNNPHLAPSTRKHGDDDTTFDTVFQSVAGDTLILRVHWPPTVSGMIIRPPAMTLAGVDARHPWIDSRMRIIGYEPIQSSDAWLRSDVLLGVAVHAVIQHLQLNPPTIIRFVDVGLSSIQPNKKQHQSNNSSRSHTPPPPPPPPPAYHESMIHSSVHATVASRQRSLSPKPPTSVPVTTNVKWPTIPPYFYELDSLSRERLEELIQNEEEFKKFAKQLPIMEEYSTIQLEQLNKNVLIAKEHLQYEKEINTLYENVTKLHKELVEKVQLFQTYEKEQDTILQPPPIHRVIRELNKAKKEAYTQSEQIAEQWLQSQQHPASHQSSSSLELSSSSFLHSNNNNNHVQNFIDEFMKVRRLQHLRAAKLEMLERLNSNDNDLKRLNL